MSRFCRIFCAALIATPTLAIASQSTDLQRPDATRYAINAVIGDLSYVDKTGSEPTPGTDGDERVRIHLEFVYGLLSRSDVSALPSEHRYAREAHLASLREYIDAGVFPRNRAYHDENRPCFIDDDGRICAVGYLVEQSAGRDVADLINAKFQYSFLQEMKLRELDDWIAASGFSPVELAMIQPNYCPPYPEVGCFNYIDYLYITDAGSSTIGLHGSVAQDDWLDSPCFGGGASSVVVNFGDAIWSSGKIKGWPSFYFEPGCWEFWIVSWGIWIDLSHTYSTPGTYTVTVTVLSGEVPVAERSWTVTVDGGDGDGTGGNPTPVAITTWGAIKAMYR